MSKIKVCLYTTVLLNFLSPALAQTTTRQNQESYSEREILVVGNPKSPNFASLPGAEREAVSIAKLFQTQALIEDAATETVVVQRLSQARIIHLATHVLPEAGVIILTPSNQDDGLLTTDEIQKLHLKADLVVLSGGNTALGQITGDGVIGIARAFIAAGATNVIGTLWCVSDQFTVKFMTEFYYQLQITSDAASALRQAALEIKKKHPNSKDWAAFTLIGSAKSSGVLTKFYN
ncbi:CHAT domain-containing protein [Mastigocladus laminosus UU774]|nr:CHAT domain-containing protein [Mastigocladus laminosus UU774]